MVNSIGTVEPRIRVNPSDEMLAEIVAPLERGEVHRVTWITVSEPQGQDRVVVINQHYRERTNNGIQWTSSGLVLRQRDACALAEWIAMELWMEDEPEPYTVKPPHPDPDYVERAAKP